jgi:hypothetical protein
MIPCSTLIGQFLRISLDYCLNLPFINPLSILHPHPKVQHLDEATCHQKKEGARSNNTLTYYMGLSNVVIAELLG